MSDSDVIERAPSVDEKITCQIDNAKVHSIQIHIKENYADTWTLEKYQAEWPDAPILSEYAKHFLAQKAKAKAAQAVTAAATEATPVPAVSEIALNVGMTLNPTTKETQAQFHELFGLGNAPAAKSSSGNPITITLLQDHDEQSRLYLPDIDPDYVFNIDLLKKVIIGFELKMNVYLWGFHGTGKTTIFEQAAAYTKRPFMRVQHTINMQESDILGQWTVLNGSTVFQPGPLPMAMIMGWVYCADEYDFAMPSVTAVYQPVLEGKPLIIKDAPPQFRRIVPHPNFRFVATGNTNGVGDETGLYQGTLVQNAANYSRFQLTEEVQYMDAAIEQSILIAKTGLDKPNATKIVKFANEVRKSFRESRISSTISPRELISAATIGIALGANWVVGLELAFANRLSRVDKKVVQEFSQRIFGGAN